MAEVQRTRVAADVDRDVVVFVIGMRINRLWAVHKWIPVFVAMPRMIAELARQPELGLLGRPRSFISGRTLLIHQVWNSFEQLDSYARSRDAAHLPAWRAFNRKIGTDGSVGIYHETYLVGPGRVETLYANMPPFGLGAALGTSPAVRGRSTAPQRLGLAAEGDDTPPVGAA
jgi:hypothetical protein